MEFENPQIPEGINVTDEHPLKGLLQLVIGLVAIIAIILFVLHYSVQYLVHYIPFEYEVAMTEEIDFFQIGDQSQQITDQELNIQAQLQLLANDLSNHMDLPDEMAITVHYSSAETVNAFATLGGHIFMYKGLIDQLDSQEALSMVMAHEIAHVKLRHPISSLGEGVTLAVLASVITGATGSSAGEALISSSSNLGLMKFSRDQEQDADFLAAQAINSKYGSILGAQSLFNTFHSLTANEQSKTLVIFLSHPHSNERWEDLHAAAEENFWSVSGKLTPLPTHLLQEDSE